MMTQQRNSTSKIFYHWESSLEKTKSRQCNNWNHPKWAEEPATGTSKQHLTIPIVNSKVAAMSHCFWLISPIDYHIGIFSFPECKAQFLN